MACLVVAALVIGASVAGYHVIVRLQSLLIWLTGAATLGYILLTIGQVDLGTVMAIPGGEPQAVVGALVMVLTGFGWINIAADWSRYQRREVPAWRIVAWNTLGGALAPVILVLYGLLLAGSSPDLSQGDLSQGIVDDPVGTLATLLPTWFLIPFGIAAILALVSGAVLGIYSSGLTLLGLGLRAPRPAAAGTDGLILTAGTVFVAQTFLGPFQSFLITLGVPIAAWAGIMIADIALRRRNYDEEALFDPRGRYGAVSWPALVVMGAASLVGWGLVVNGFAEDAAWNNWQGYLIQPLGLGVRLPDGSWDGAWPYANLGVLLALMIGFLGTLVLGRHAVGRQEGRAAR